MYLLPEETDPAATLDLCSRNHRAARAFLALMLVITILSASIARAAPSASGGSRVLPQLQQEAGQKPAATFRVIVTSIDGADDGDDKRPSRQRNGKHEAERAVREAGGKRIKRLKHNAFTAELPGRAIEAIGRHPKVKYVAPDAPMIPTGRIDRSRLATLYADAVNAPLLWSGAATGTALTGMGVGVAILDSGVDPLRTEWRGADGLSRIVAQARFTTSASELADGNGHGTHVAGIVGGNSWHHGQAGHKGRYIGIAPEANLIDVKVADDAGMSYTSDVVRAIDWVVEHRRQLNIRVMNLSLVSSVAESYKTSVLNAAVERAWFNGILVVVAAGNAGPNTVNYPPANDPFVITVGAADTMNTAARGDDGMAPWSSYGRTQDGVAKPDVVAPGRMLAAPLSAITSTLALQLPGRVVDGDYIKLSGTSMAAPVVAGAAALLFEAHPEWTNDQVKWVLQRTASRLQTTAAPLDQGAGEVDAEAAVRYKGRVHVANQGLAINEQLVGPNGATSYANEPSASWSTASWSTSSWSTASWSTASWSTASWSTANSGASTWATYSELANGEVE